MVKNLISEPILARLAQIWAKFFLVGFTSTRCWALSQAIIARNFQEK